MSAVFSKIAPRLIPRGSQCPNKTPRFVVVQHFHHPSLPSVRHYVLHAQSRTKVPSKIQSLSQQCQQRQQKSTVEKGKELWRENPISVSLAAIFILFGAGCLVFANYFYIHYIIGGFSRYPEPVAKKLRRALFYANPTNLDIKEAIKYYMQALVVADEIGMNPFGDEVMGIKVHLAAFLEKHHNYKPAIEILEIIKKDCFKWVEELGPKHFEDGHRTRMLKRTVELNTKLGELYSNVYVDERDKAEACLIEGAETYLKERNRRNKQGIKEGEGDWMSEEEAGASMEALAHNYEEKDMHYLASPLFLSALSLSPPNSCHTVILMNNLATSLAQSRPPPSGYNSDPQPSPPREVLLSQAKAWAQKAIEISKQIKSPNRTEECEIGCATATHNLGELAEMAGEIEEARKRYEEARALAKRVGFEEGVKQAEEAKRRLDQRV
ncbi:hypothetical protein M501DRAFT_1015312 [Patellaria atrata CBS 101060]|uniref:TPR domain-containing protein n=1 Tax=Patellaria atrata CBS 101060 TaxID=1346257 RepID=A0A9P4SEP6_9PEZI|nr:hypothetical protein M501DRAFT_1015312 [Patellaria atrata CBS 101060]